MLTLMLTRAFREVPLFFFTQRGYICTEYTHNIQSLKKRDQAKEGITINVSELASSIVISPPVWLLHICQQSSEFLEWYLANWLA